MPWAWPLIIALLAPWTAMAEPEKPKMLLLDLKATLIEADAVGIITNMMSAEMASYEDHFEIITNADMRQMVALEAEKQSMGCADDSSCLAELAGAMGARFVMFGEVGKLGKNIIITLNLFDSQEAKAAGRVIVRAKSLDEVPDKIPPALTKLVKKFVPQTPVAAAVVSPPSSTPAPKVTKAPAEPVPAPEPKDEADGEVASDSSFPWLPVTGLVVVAAAGGAAAGLYGWPAYSTAVESEKAYQAVRDDNSPQSVANYDQAQADQQAFFAGPVYGMVGGAVVGLAAASFALYLTGDALSQGAE
ncbi:MAG: hypothetical protein CMH56_03630 [Myxococcales bacterium]|nr:hypothetical protein [Myxococcales bacterium]